MIVEKLMADVMEIADEWDRDAQLVELLADVRHGGGGLVPVDGDAHELRAGSRQRRHLRDRQVDVGGVRVGHRLHDDRRPAAERHRALSGADRHRAGVSPRGGLRRDGGGAGFGGRNVQHRLSLHEFVGRHWFLGLLVGRFRGKVKRRREKLADGTRERPLALGAMAGCRHDRLLRRP